MHPARSPTSQPFRCLLFSLDGTIESLPRGSANPAGQFPVRGGGTHGGSARSRDLTRDEIVSIVTVGMNDMPAFGATLSQHHLQDLASYLLEELLDWTTLR